MTSSLSNLPPDSTPEQTANRLFGPGNWVRCAKCPQNDGHPSIHPPEAHDKAQHPTARPPEPV